MKSCSSCAALCEDAARFCLECGFAFEEQPDEAPDPWLGRRVAGRYEIKRKLGEGGMGEVYVAEQLPMGREVALKILRANLSDDPQQVERFQREAQAASQLSHPNSIIIHDFGEDPHDGTLFIAMECLQGEALNDVLDAEGSLAPERAAHILMQVCGSLEEAHGRGVIHRDLKPENIFLVERGGTADFVKVLDFGIAKVTQSATGGKLDTITRAGAIFGTPQYMSPEQIRGDELDPRSDVYALGVILYQAISGHLPFSAATVVEMLTKHLSATPAPIAHGDSTDQDSLARLEAVALRALSKDPAQRQASARVFLEDLMAAVPQLSLNSMTGLVPASAAGPALDVLPGPVGGAERGNAGLVVLLTALIAAGGAGAFFYLQPGGGPSGSAGAPAVLAQEAAGGDEGGEGGEAAEGEAKEGEEAAPAEQAEPAGEAAAEEDAEPSAEEKAEAEKVEAEAEEEAKAIEQEEAAEEKADEKLSEAEAKAAEAEAEAEARAAEAEEKAAKAEQKAKAEAEKKAKAEADKKAAEAAKAEAEAAKKAAEAAKAEAEAAKEAADQEKEAALAAAKAAKEQAEAAAATAAAAKAEADALKAQMQKIEEEKAAAEAKAKEAALKAKAAKAKKKAAKKRKRVKKPTIGKVLVKAPVGAKIYINGRYRGKAPMKVLRLKPGKHRFEARKGKKKTKKSITVKARGLTRVNLR